MEELFRCKICHELYDTTTRKPLILPCGHTICEYCLKIIFASNQIKCPFDKKVHTFKERQDIGINQQLYDFIAAEKSLNEDAKCQLHSKQILKFYCNVEQCPLCQICLVSNHLGPKHQILALKDTIFCDKVKERNKEILNASKNSIVNSKKILMEIEEDSAKFEDDMKKMRENLLNTIELQYSEAITQFSLESQKEILDYENKMKEIQSTEMDIKKELTELDKISENDKLLFEISEKCDLREQKIGLPIKPRRSSDFKDDLSLPLLSKNQKNLYLLAQNSNYDPKNQKMLHSLFSKGILKNKMVFSALTHVSRKNFVKPEDKNVVFDDIYKSLKFGFNYNVPSPVITARLLEELKPMDLKRPHILEIGCGTGYITACLAYLIRNKGKVVCVENNQNLLDLAKKNIRDFHADIFESIEFQLKDYKNLNFEPESFDLIVISVIFPGFPIEFEQLLARKGVMWVTIGSNFAKNSSSYVFEKDSKGEVRSRRVEVPENSIMSYF